MPFDPKLIHPDDAPLNAAGDLDLPDHLTALAEQMKDDAAHLAARYPADRPRRSGGVSLPMASPVRFASLARMAIVLAGASLASIAIIGLSLSFSWFPDTAGPSTNSVVSSPGEAAVSMPEPVAPQVPITPVSSGTTLSLGELSGPELEALLDLKPVTTSVSF